MKIIEKEVKIKKENLIDSGSMFFDIETTGFSRTSARIYLIGTLGREDNKYIFRQFLTQGSADEKEILKLFLKLVENYERLISFNGDAFDLPFIKARCKRHAIDSSVLEEILSIDIYRLIKEKALFMNLENYKLKTIERYMGIFREDLFSGGELISLYYEYENGDKNLEDLLLLHNEEDILNMPNIYEFLDLIAEENTVRVKDADFLIEKISLDKNKLKIFGKSNLPMAFFQGPDFKMTVEDHDFVFESFVQGGLYNMEGVTCIYIEKKGLELICNYAIPSPQEIYLLKHDKNQLNLNIRLYFKKAMESLLD